MRRLTLPPLSRMVSKQEVHFPAVPKRHTQTVWITSMGFEHCRLDYVVDRRCFAGIGIEIVVGGCGAVMLDGNESALLPGSVFMYGPRTRHRIWCNGSAALRKYFIDIDGPGARSFVAQAGMRPGSVRLMNDPESARALAQMLMEQISGVEHGGSDAVIAGLRYLLLLTVSQKTRPARQSRVDIRMAEVRAFIEDNHPTLHGLSDIARQVGIEPAYLCRVFHRQWGISPGQFLTRQKLENAARQLTSTSRAVKEVAAAVGFEDPLHFSRNFRRHFGVSPTDFRDHPRFQANRKLDE